MSRPWFLWNNRYSYNMHVRSERAEIIRPEERVEHVTIPGRSGDLTLTEGEDIYNPYIRTVPVSVVGLSHMEEAERWLRGDGYVTFDSQPELKQKARIIGAVNFQKHSRNVDTWHGNVQFYCQPWKTLLEEEPFDVTESGTEINNPGTVAAMPRIQITGSGTVSISIGNKTLVIPACQTGWTADCENKWILNAGGEPQFSAWSGKFPTMEPGSNYIRWTGNITKLTITPGWRFL